MSLTRWRRPVQVGTLALFVAVPILNRHGITVLTGSLFSFAVGPVWITDPLSGAQVILATGEVTVRLLVSMAIPIALALTLGRVFCGWICPQNALSEVGDWLARRLKLRRLFGPSPTARPRYVILALFFAAVPVVGLPVANYISAPGILSVQPTRYAFEGALDVDLALIAAILAGELLVLRRAWCNYVCPIGGFLGLFRTRYTLKVVHREEMERTCDRCFSCKAACQLGLDPTSGRIYPLCHNCGDCITACKARCLSSTPLSFRFKA